MQSVSVQSMYFSYVALSSSFKEICIQAKIEENFFELSHWETYSTFQQLRKLCFWKFFYVGSTYIDFIRVVKHCCTFWSELKCCPNCRARRQLSWTFILFFSLFFCCLTSVSKNLFWHMSLQVHLVCPWPAKDEAGTVVRNLFPVCQLACCVFSYALNMYMPA